VEDLAFRYLAVGERVDNWALSAFRRRHGRALNDAFTQVLEWARSQGMVKLGRVAIDSTRITANASRDRVDREQALRDTRPQLRRQVRAWQQAAVRDDAEPGGLDLAIGELNKALEELPRRMERLKKSGLKKLSRTDEDARFLRQRGGFVLGYTAEIAVSDDHLIVAQIFPFLSFRIFGGRSVWRCGTLTLDCGHERGWVSTDCTRLFVCMADATAERISLERSGSSTARETMRAPLLICMREIGLSVDGILR